MGAFLELSDPELARRLVNAAEQVWGAERVARGRSETRHHPTRVLANAGVNVAWRSEPVEDVHAGAVWNAPLEERRVTPDEERLLMRFASDAMAQVMTACERLARERPRRPWAEQVLPYALAQMMLVTPTDWTLTEASREMRLHQGRRNPPSAP